MNLRQAQRNAAKIRCALQGPSGSGKSMSALLLAFGLVNDWSKIAVIDTENQSADLYAHLGNYNVLTLEKPYSPERYMKAIETCEEAGMQVIIIDSLSHEWSSSGGILEQHGNMEGNSFTNWGKLTPRHNAFMQRLLHSPAHILATLRTKQDYVINSNSDGKVVPEKVGLKAVTRDDAEYEFTLVFSLDMEHMASCSKDRTGVFVTEPPFKIDAETGMKIKEWCSASSAGVDFLKEANEEKEQTKVMELIKAAKTFNELKWVYDTYPQFQKELEYEFNMKRSVLQNSQPKNA